MTNKNTTSLRLQELMVFDAILSNGSITAAAEALGVTQSSVSKQLKILREYFGDVWPAVKVSTISIAI